MAQEPKEPSKSPSPNNKHDKPNPVFIVSSDSEIVDSSIGNLEYRRAMPDECVFRKWKDEDYEGLEFDIVAYDDDSDVHHAALPATMDDIMGQNPAINDEKKDRFGAEKEPITEDNYLQFVTQNPAEFVHQYAFLTEVYLFYFELGYSCYVIFCIFVFLGRYTSTVLAKL